MRERLAPEAQAESGQAPSARVVFAGRVALWISLVVATTLTGWVFLDRYQDPAAVAPAGSDTAQHQWRIAVVADAGIDALPPFEGQAQALNTNADRPGLPVIGAIASATGIADPRVLAYVLPAVMAAIIGLAAAGFARAASRARAWSLPGYVLGVGASVPVALAANGYLDQLLVMPLLIGAGACVVAAGRDRRVYLASALLLGAAFAVHWQFAAAFSGLLVLVSIGAIPSSIAERRAGASWRRLAVVSTLATTACGLAVGAAALLIGPGTPLRAPLGLTRDGIAANLERQLPLYHLPWSALVAAGGVVALLVRRASRLSVWLVGPWALVPAVAAILYETGRDVPVQRTLTFALAIPILGVALLEGIVRAGRWWAGREGTVFQARVTAVVLTSLALVPIAASVAYAHDAWMSRPPSIPDDQLAQLRAAARYVDEAGRPAIVVVDMPETGQGAPGADFGSVPMLRRLRAQLEPDLILDVTPYLGDPDDLLEGAPTLRPDVPGFDHTSLELWDRVRPLLSRDPVVIVLRPFDASFGRLIRDHPRWQATDWLAVVRGPTPGSDVTELSAPIAPSFGSLLGSATLFLAGVSLAGVGWAIAIGPSDLLARCCLAPATGLAALVVAGLFSERLGVRTGERGTAIAIVVAAGGIIAATYPIAVRRFRSRSFEAA